MLRIGLLSDTHIPSTVREPPAILRRIFQGVDSAEMVTRRSFSLALWLVLLVAGVGCGGEPTVYEELLGIIPDTEETRSFVLINDYALAREQFDISLPGPEVGVRAVVAYVYYVYGRGAVEYPRLGLASFISGYGPYAKITNPMFRQHFAFDARNVGQSVLAGEPPREFEVVRGSFAPKVTEETLKACAGCQAPLRGEHRSVSFYSWGGDLEGSQEMAFALPAFDQDGRGGRIVVQDEYVFRTTVTSDLEALIDASLGQRRSLADVEEFRLLAKGASELSAYSVLFSDQTQGAIETVQALAIGSLTEEDWNTINRAFEQSLLLRPYQAFATGVGRESIEQPLSEQYMVLVLVHADGASAEENTGLLRQRILETTSLLTGQPRTELVSRMEIRAEGRVLLAKLYGGIVAQWFDWVRYRDPLLVHE